MIERKQIKNKEVFSKMENIKCQKCKKKFGIDVNHIGIITCPYCGGYVEG